MGGEHAEEAATLERYELPVDGGAVCEVNELCPEVEGAGRVLAVVRGGEEDEEEDDDVRRGDDMPDLCAKHTLRIRGDLIPGLVATLSHGRDRLQPRGERVLWWAMVE
jgi:hypothetical protein